jgi:hypothetical protein
MSLVGYQVIFYALLNMVKAVQWMNTMVKSNIQIPQKSMSVPEAINAMLRFMNEQMVVNAGVMHNMGAVETYIINPLFKGMDAGKVTCVSAIK